MVDFKISRIGPIWSNSNNNDAIESIRDTINSTVAASGEKKIEMLKLFSSA